MRLAVAICGLMLLIEAPTCSGVTVPNSHCAVTVSYPIANCARTLVLDVCMGPSVMRGPPLLLLAWKRRKRGVSSLSVSVSDPD